MVDVELAAVRAYGQCGSHGLVMSSALERACLGLSSFRMCHDDLLFNVFTIYYLFVYCYYLSKQPFQCVPSGVCLGL